MDSDKTKTNNPGQPNSAAPLNNRVTNAAELNDALAVARQAASAAANAAEDATDNHTNIATGTSPANATSPNFTNPYDQPATSAQSPVTPNRSADTSEQPPYDPFASKTTKKPHKGKIAAIIIIIILLLAGIGGAIWLFAFYNQPSRIALDAMTHLLSAEHVTMQGTATSTMTYIDSGDSYTSTFTTNANYNQPGAQQFQLEYSSDSSDSTDSSGLGTLSFTMQRNSGQLFASVSGLDDLLTSYLSLYSDDTYCEDDVCYSLDEDMQVDTESTGEDTDSTTSEDTDTATDETTASADFTIDDIWWQIDPTTLSDYLGLDEQVGEIATCLLSDNNIASLSSSLTTAYTDHSFFTAENYTGSEIKSDQRLIQLDINASALADFIFDYYNNSLRPAIEGCAGALDAISIDDANELAENITGEQLPTIVLEANFWTHQLTSYNLSETTEDDYYETTLAAQFSFTYPSSLSIALPNEYEDITTLLDQLGFNSNTVETLEETYLPNVEI